MGPIGHSNRDHATSSKRGCSERFTTELAKADFDRLLNKALQATVENVTNST